MRLRLSLLFVVIAAGGLAQPTTTEGFAIPEPGHHFTAADIGAHPEFKIEWWYVTGHLFAKDQRRYGFQATFFRFAGGRNGPKGTPSFSNRELYLAHMALSDPNRKRFIFEERVNREGWDAHAAIGSLDVTNGGWLLRQSGASPALELKGAVRAEAAFELALTPAKPLVVFGENGVSRKGADLSAASYYLTYSRLLAAGKLTVGTETFEVSGEAWMDHEISSSQLSGGEIGWDWVSIQLKDDPRELMLYRLRHPDGTPDAASRLQWVDPRGQARTAGFDWQVLSTWKSPKSGATYPAKVRLTTRDPQTGQPATFVLEPLLDDQELNGAVAGSYWEGACRVRDEQGREVGSAYLELTGYAAAPKVR